MIISHEHKFIFIHCRKVAGSSVKVALAPYLGPDDIVIGSWNEILEAGLKLNDTAQSILETSKARLFYWAGRLSGKSHPEAANIVIKAFYRDRLSVNPPHPTALEVRSYFPNEWSSFFKFAFTRNPYERTASDYYWRVRMTGKGVSFREYLELLKNKDHSRNIIHPGGASNWDMMAINGNLSMDFVGHYENLDCDFTHICNRLGLPIDSIGASEKVNTKTCDYSSLYGEKEKRVVREIFAEELDYFGYEFPY
jgi:hypothetical protein